VYDPSDRSPPLGVDPGDLAALHPSDSGCFAQILAITFASATVRSDRVVAVTLDCSAGHRGPLRVTSMTPGFDVEMLPDRARDRGQVIAAIRIHRRLGTIRRLCLLRFSVGSASAVASITVLH
jgi:hypothetical protein